MNDLIRDEVDIFARMISIGTWSLGASYNRNKSGITTVRLVERLGR